MQYIIVMLVLMASAWTWFFKCLNQELKGKNTLTKTKWRKEFKKAAHKCQKLYTETHPKKRRARTR